MHHVKVQMKMLCTVEYGNVASYVHRAKHSYGLSCSIAEEAAGFEYVGSSDVNSNAADVPSEEEFVWRLPPSRSGTEEGTPERAAYDAIGESNRMTLKFRKPA